MPNTLPPALTAEQINQWINVANPLTITATELASLGAGLIKKTPEKKDPVKKDGTIRSELSDYYKFKKYNGTYGLEIETETKSADTYGQGFFKPRPADSGVRYDFPEPMSAWEGHEDNSLRNFGMEFVLKEPLKYDDALTALDDFATGTDHVAFLKNAPATSVHVHVNFLPETFLTLANFLTIYTLFENVLVDFSGPTRRSNLFALPIRAAERTEGNIVGLFKNISQGQYMLGLSTNNMKYAAVNIATLTHIGSIELRSFRGTTDVREIKEWLGIINRLFIYSKAEGLTPPDILRSYHGREGEFVDEVFGEFASVLREKVSEFDRLVERNLWHSMKIKNAVDDWSKINTAISDTAAKSKKPVKKMSGLQPSQTYIHIDDVVPTGSPHYIEEDTDLD